jgi:transposase
MPKTTRSISTHPSDQPSLKPCRRRFSESFKRDAVRLVTHEGYTIKAAATAVGVTDKSLRDWHRKRSPPPVPCGPNANVGQLQEENRRLQQQLKRAELERDILKKATAYFAKESS